MTPQQESEHCAIEKICRLYHHRTYEYNKDLSCGMTCEHDTRSRPHNPAPDYGMTPEQRKYILSFHEEDPLLMAYVEGQKAGAAQAREEVLTEIIEHLQSKRGEVMRMATDAYPVGVLDGTVLYLESLRTGGEPR